MDQLEVIIVNDGTPDRSAEMSREYTVRYPQTFRQIDQENRGHGGAWNRGLKEATGKYLRFLDSDDWLTNLDKLMEKLAVCDADIVFSDYVIHYICEGKTQRYSTSTFPNGEQVLTGMLIKTFKQGYIELNFWYNTYKTEILKPLHPLFAENVMYDDSVLSFAPLILGRSFESFPIVVYNYLIGRPGQSMNPAVQKKNAYSYLMCLQHEERLFSSIVQKNIPADLMGCIDAVIYEYANYVFPSLVNLSYRQSKFHLKRIVTTYPLRVGYKMSHCMRRYKMLPFPLFYLLEKLRQSRK